MAGLGELVAKSGRGENFINSNQKKLVKIIRESDFCFSSATGLDFYCRIINSIIQKGLELQAVKENEKSRILKHGFKQESEQAILFTNKELERLNLELVKIAGQIEILLALKSLFLEAYPLEEMLGD